MRYFCTYFDRNYLTRGLALFASLRTHCPAFHLWVLCFDEESYAILSRLRMPGLEPMALADFLRDDPALAAARTNRSPVEFYFTCSPSLPLYLLRRHPEIDLLTYLDADLFFYSSPEPLFAEIGSASVAIIPHRFPPRLQDRLVFGLYNVGFLSFRPDTNGLACLNWWRERCLEWCFARPESGRYGDQKYLDDWPARFPGVAVVQNPGANLAFWNMENHRITKTGQTIQVDGHPLVFFHFHSVRRLRTWLYDLRWREYRLPPNRLLLRNVFVPYLAVLGIAERRVASLWSPGQRPTWTSPLPDAVTPATAALQHRLSAAFYDLRRVAHRILRHHYVAAVFDRPVVWPI